jgi:hypothetical protein
MYGGLKALPTKRFHSTPVKESGLIEQCRALGRGDNLPPEVTKYFPPDAMPRPTPPPQPQPQPVAPSVYYIQEDQVGAAPPAPPSPPPAPAPARNKQPVLAVAGASAAVAVAVAFGVVVYATLRPSTPTSGVTVGPTRATDSPPYVPRTTPPAQSSSPPPAAPRIREQVFPVHYESVADKDQAVEDIAAMIKRHVKPGQHVVSVQMVGCNKTASVAERRATELTARLKDEELTALAKATIMAPGKTHKSCAVPSTIMVILRIADK